MKHVNKLLLGTIILAASNLTYADEWEYPYAKEEHGFAFATSAKLEDSDRFVAVGKSTKDTTWVNGIHRRNKAGIGFTNGKQNILGIGEMDVKDKADFEGLTHSKRVKKKYDAGVTVNQMHKPFREDKPWWDLHGDLGSFNFVRVGAGDVWFGEWSQNGNEGSTKFKGRQVFHIGDRKNVTMPSSGSATYKTRGLNKFTRDNPNVLSGVLTANFGAHTLEGSIDNGVNQLKIETEIDNHASFDGAASFNEKSAGDKFNEYTSTLATGRSEGHFFGNKASSLAGIATFDTKDHDVSFGGTKNP